LSTAADRYAQFKRNKSIERTPLLNKFLARLDFPIDDFQLQALTAIDSSDSVLVAAPTGAGKTLIAEFGIEKALASKKRIFYTTPIKALSNQKFRDFVALYGEGNVGLLTGDRKINPYAPVLVMTTEILRNMIYSESQDIGDLGWVVMDEVHYLADKFRGAVWEETLILLPKEVGLICLSATVSNAEEFGNWLASVRGSIKVVVDEKRPTPLWQLVFHDGKLSSLFAQQIGSKASELNPAVSKSRSVRSSQPKSSKFQRGSINPIERLELINILEFENKLPAIFFIFSRNGCDKAAHNISSNNFSLLSKMERERVLEICKMRTLNIDLDDLRAVDFDEFLSYVSKGIATHHAGMLPIFKELVEELFQLGLIKVVFATETLALGINMPARTVVVESLRKFDGTKHVDLTPGEFTQLTGRAGRRGIDDEGYAVVPTAGNISPQVVASLASARTYPLRSSFKPSYNMSLNLIDKYGLDRSVKYLESSFAQYQLDRQVSHLVERSRNLEKKFEDSKVQFGDEYEIVKDYFLKNEELNVLEREMRIKKAFQNTILDRNDNMIRPGSVVSFDSSNNVYVVVDVNMAKSNFSVISLTSGYQKIHWNDIENWPIVFDYIRIPRGFNPRDKLARKRLLNQIKTKPIFDIVESKNQGTAVDDLRSQVSEHPFHSLHEQDRKIKLMRTVSQIEYDLTKLQNKIGNRTSSLGRQFKQISNLLKEKEYITDDNLLTSSGLVLSKIYAECDLLVAESIGRGYLQGLTNSELAAVLSIFIYEGKQLQEGYATSVPTKKVKEVLLAIESLLADLQVEENSRGITQTRNVDASFTVAIHDWVSRVNLDTVLEESNLAPGDFVRWVKQVIDLSNQLINCDLDESLKQQLRAVKKEANYGIIYISESSLVNIE
jgi:ATP-dependent RNA helicase HelY